MKIIKNNLILLILIIIGFCFFSFKLLSIPPGLETDEESIAYNAALISTNLRDQNNRLLPIFILSTGGSDWKQPVLIYFMAILFRLFGKTFFIYKMANVLISLFSGIILYFIAKIIFKNQKYAITAFLIYITTPIVFITTRIGNESILPSLISTLWLLTLILYKNINKKYFLILNAIIIGIGFYSFKGMRIISPIWSIISFVYIYYLNWSKNRTILKNLFNKKNIKAVLLFSIFLLPFYLITPLLELKYTGAVFDKRPISIDSIYNFFYYWLSNISLSSLFATPDIGRVYTVSNFGAFPLPLLPFFIIGVVKSISQKNYFRFILICFISSPILFGLARSINYPHRLMAIVPFVILITLYGIKNTLLFFKTTKSKNITKIIIYFSLFLTSTIFYKFYFINYPKLNSTTEAFGRYTYPSFKSLSNFSHKYKLDPFVEEEIYKSETDEHKFYNLILFQNQLQIWKLGEKLPEKSILLTKNNALENCQNLEITLPHDFHILIRNE